MRKQIVLGTMIDYYRREKKLTMEDLGKHLDKSTSAISRWISGERSPKVDDLEHLASIFDCTVEDLLFGKQNESAHNELISSEKNTKNDAILINKINSLSPTNKEFVITTVDHLYEIDSKENNSNQDAM